MLNTPISISVKAQKAQADLADEARRNTLLPAEQARTALHRQARSGVLQGLSADHAGLPVSGDQTPVFLCVRALS